jgi:hypothetical protein
MDEKQLARIKTLGEHNYIIAQPYYHGFKLPSNTSILSYQITAKIGKYYYRTFLNVSHNSLTTQEHLLADSEQIIIPDFIKKIVSDDDIKKIEFIENKNIITDYLPTNYFYRRYFGIKVNYVKSESTKVTIDKSYISNIYNILSTEIISDGQIFYYKADNHPDLILTVNTYNCNPIRVYGGDCDVIIIVDGERELKISKFKYNQSDKYKYSTWRTTNTLYDTQNTDLLSRMIKPDIVRKLGKTFLKGIIVNSPTYHKGLVFAKRLCGVLCSTEHRIINYNDDMTELFDDDIREYEKYGDVSLLNICIFDQFDRICKYKKHVVDQISNVLEKCNNILILGIVTNSKPYDNRLKGPGLFELEYAFGDLDEDGFYDIMIKSINKEDVVSDDLQYMPEDTEVKKLSDKIDRMNADNMDLFKHMTYILEKLTNK